MICVTVFAGAKNKEFFDALVAMTLPCFSPISVWRGEIKSHGKEPQLLITDDESFYRIDMLPQILVFGGKGQYDLAKAGNVQTVAIVDSCDHDQLAGVASTGLPAITCGLFAKDTITLSSMRGDGAVINLQRCITCFNGDVAEPQEIPVHFARPIDNYLLMAVASVFILSGKSDRLALQDTF